MSHRVFPKLLLLLCLSAVPGSVWAQGFLAQEYMFKPKPGMGAALVTALRAHAEWRAENGDPWEWSTYEVAAGEDMGSILVRSDGHTWADWDAYEASFALQGSTHFNATVGPLLESTTSSINMLDTTITRWPEDGGDFSLFRIYIYHLIPSTGQQFTQAIKKIHDAIVQEDYPATYGFVTPVVGETGPKMILVVPASSWADFEEPERPMDQMLAELYGPEEAAQIFSDFNNSYTKIESRVLRLRPDLSVMTDPRM